MTGITKKTLEAAARRVAPFIHKTPVLTSAGINTMAGSNLFFKCENFQKVGAFKYRGATNAIRQQNPDLLKKGVATHSSGNHAQALALAAKILGIPAYIVMPENAPKSKKSAVEGYGGKIIECAPTLAARERTLQQVIHETGAIFIHPYNDDLIIAGQATCAMEIYEEIGIIDYILAPVGGGGLLSGTALASRFFSPETKVIGCEPAGADDAYRSLQAGKIIPSVNPHTIADGLLTSLGDKTFPIIKKYVSRIITCDDKQIISAMQLIWQRLKVIVEPSAAVPLAVVLNNQHIFKNKRVAVILSGGNVDFDKIPF